MKAIYKNHEFDQLINIISTSFIAQQQINPNGTELITSIGHGREKNNLEAITCWVDNSIYQMTEASGSLMCILHEMLCDEISIMQDATNDDSFHVHSSY